MPLRPGDDGQATLVLHGLSGEVHPEVIAGHALKAVVFRVIQVAHSSIFVHGRVHVCQMTPSREFLVHFD